MYSHNFFTTSVRGNGLLPTTGCNAGPMFIAFMNAAFGLRFTLGAAFLATFFAAFLGADFFAAFLATFFAAGFAAFFAAAFFAGAFFFAFVATFLRVLVIEWCK